MLVVPRFTRSLFRRSRRPLIGSVVLLILGGAILAYSLPYFLKSLETVRNQEDEISGNWPPDVRLAMEIHRREAYENFYRWTTFTSLGILIVIIGLYFGVVKWYRGRKPAKDE